MFGVSMRRGDSDFDEKEGQECKDGCLDEADEDLEHHEGHRPRVRNEEGRNEYQHLAGKDVAEKTEGK